MYYIQPSLRACLSTSAPRALATPVDSKPKNLKTFSIYRWVGICWLACDAWKQPDTKATSCTFFQLCKLLPSCLPSITEPRQANRKANNAKLPTRSIFLRSHGFRCFNQDQEWYRSYIDIQVSLRNELWIHIYIISLPCCSIFVLNTFSSSLFLQAIVPRRHLWIVCYEH